MKKKYLLLIFLYIIFLLTDNIYGQSIDLNSELKEEKLSTRKINDNHIIIFIDKYLEAHLKSYPKLKKTVLFLNGKQDTLHHYIQIQGGYFSAAYKTKLNTKKTDFLILTNYPSNCLGSGCRLIEVSIIELKNNKANRFLYFSNMLGHIELIKIKNGKIYIYILEEDMMTQDYFKLEKGIDLHDTYQVSIFKLNKNFKLEFQKDTFLNGCYDFPKSKNKRDFKLVKIPCPLGYEPKKEPLKIWNKCEN